MQFLQCAFNRIDAMAARHAFYLQFNFFHFASLLLSHH
jgi:hypothetical protein